MDNFFAMDIQRAGMQALETAYIIGTSKNIETIKSRYNFLLNAPEVPQGLDPALSILDTLKKGQSNPQYSTLIETACDNYKTNYYDRPLQDYQLNLVTNPNGFDLNSFYCISLVNAVKRFCAEQAEDINAMKKETAKAKRAAKVLETIRTTQTELQAKCSTASSYSTALAEIQNLEITFNYETV
mgnify:CR=1 FL=1